MPMQPHPSDGSYKGRYTHPTPGPVPFRVVGDRLFWGDPEVEFKWHNGRWEAVDNEDHYLYFFDSPTTDDKFFIEHDLVPNPPFVAGGTYK
ncbi:MAG: hypothetical protein GY906_13085 [bacterium]|nr:hypothetical protein [bacterium]